LIYVDTILSLLLSIGGGLAYDFSASEDLMQIGADTKRRAGTVRVELIPSRIILPNSSTHIIGHGDSSMTSGECFWVLSRSRKFSTEHDVYGPILYSYRGSTGSIIMAFSYESRNLKLARNAFLVYASLSEG